MDRVGRAGTCPWEGAHGIPGQVRLEMQSGQWDLNLVLSFEVGRKAANLCLHSSDFCTLQRPGWEMP